MVRIYSWPLQSSGTDISVRHSTGKAPLFLANLDDRVFRKEGGLPYRLLPIGVQLALAWLFVHLARQAGLQSKP